MESSSPPHMRACDGIARTTCRRRLRREHDRAVGLGVVLLLWVAAASAALAITLVSVEQEIEIGREANAQVRKEVPELTDPEVRAYVRGLGRRLAQVAPGPKYPYSISVANYR